MSARITWMDTLRGSAIALLLVWHASSIPTFYGFEMPQWLYLVNEVFLPWRMPALYVLSGLLLEKSLRKDTATYMVGKLRVLAWPYLLWAVLHITTFDYSVWSVWSPRSYIANGYLWFIFYLFIYYAIAPVVTRLPGYVVLPVLVVSTAVTTDGIVHRGLYFAIFFFGAYVARDVIRLVPSAPPTLIGIALPVAASFTAASLYLSARTDSHYFAYQAWPLLGNLALIFLSIRLAAFAADRWRDRSPMAALQWVGRNSVVFYLVHFPIMGATCHLVRASGLSLGLWVVPVCVCTAVAASVSLGRLRDVVPVSWLFEAPRVLDRLPRHRPEASRQRLGAHS